MLTLPLDDGVEQITAPAPLQRGVCLEFLGLAEEVMET
jgi:hypothetical protein